MSTLITILHIMVCIFLMLTVLLQSGKGGGMGAAFGGGNAATVFGGSGASSFLRRLTAGAGTLFMVTSMVLAFIASHNSADALEKFGEQQEKLAAEKEAAKQKVLDSGAGSAAGSASGSASTGSAAGSATDGSAAGAAAGSAMDPADIQNGPTGGMSGTAVTPSENPVPATRPDQKPNPATPTSMSPPTGDQVKPTAEANPATAPAAPATGSAAPAAGSAAPAAAPAPAAGAPDVKLSDPKDLKPTDTAKPADSSPNAPK